MSIEEKLQKCVDFIRRIEKNDGKFQIYVSGDDIRGDFKCYECGCSDVYGSTYIGIPAALRDEAWHLLADIDGL